MKTFAFLILALASLSAWAAPVFRVPLQVDKDTSEIIGRTDFFEANKALLNDSVESGDWIDPTKPPYNATGDGSTDDSDELQAAIDASGTNWKRLYLPGGRTFAIEKPLVFVTTNFMSFAIQGNFATIKVVGPTNAFKIGSKTLYSGLMENLIITYDQAYTSTNAKAVSYVGNPETTPYWNAYNVRHRNVLIYGGYWGFVQENGMSVWGSSWSDCVFEQQMTGGAMNLYPSTDFGNPNNVIERCYVRADNMAEPFVFLVKNQNTFTFRENECNVLTNKALLYLSASTSADIRRNRIEVGKMASAYGSLFAWANCTDLRFELNQVQNFEFNPPTNTWAFLIRDYSSVWSDSPSHTVDGIVLKTLTPPSSGGLFSLIASDNQRVQLGSWSSDQPASYPHTAIFYSSGTLSNVTALKVLRSTNSAPKVRGEFTFDSAGWPHIAKSFTGTPSDWLRLGDGDLSGPGASTDRSVMVWDGATGKRAANSLVSLSVDGSLTTPGQALNFGPGYGNPIIHIYGSHNGVRGTRLYSGSNLRWEQVTSSGGETTNDNSGSDLEWRAYGISGTNQAAFLQTVAKLRRSDGRLALRQPLEIGGLLYTNAPNIAHWTNVSFSSPEGLETAPPGSIRLGMDGLVWRKASGEGNTGWTTNFGAATVSGGGTNTVLGSRAAGNVIADTGTDLISTNSIDGARIGTGTVADARIDSAIARDSEVTSAVSVGRTNFTAGQTIASFNAFQAHAPASNPAASATRNAIPVLEFDASTPQQARWLVQIPNGYTSSTVTVLLRWTTTATSGNGRWGVRFWDITGEDVDSDSFATPSESTTACSGTAGTTVVTSIGSVNLDGAAGGEVAILEVYRDVGDAADTINSNTLQLPSVEVRAE